MNALEEKCDAAREKAVQMLREYGMYSSQFREAFDESFELCEELKRKHPESELLRTLFIAKMLKRTRTTKENTDDNH